jgi:hypothetical protein
LIINNFSDFSDFSDFFYQPSHFSENNIDNKKLNPPLKKKIIFFYKSELSELSEKLLIDKGLQIQIEFRFTRASE